MAGVIHVGVHNGGDAYLKNFRNVVGFEPIKEQCELFHEKYPEFDCFNIALSDYDGKATFYITNDGADGQCSSLLMPKDSIIEMTGGIKEERQVDVRRFDSWAQSRKFNIHGYTELLIDVQGNELAVLKGFGALIGPLLSITVECSEDPLYEGGATAREVIDYLDGWDFGPMTPLVKHGDIIFMKRGAWYEKAA